MVPPLTREFSHQIAGGLRAVRFSFLLAPPNFTNIVLPGKGHFSAMMAGFIPQAYGNAAFIVANNPS